MRRRSCCRASTSAPTRPQADALLAGRAAGLRLRPRRPSQRRPAGREVPPTARHRSGRDHQLQACRPWHCWSLSQLEPGDHVVVSNQLYGRTARCWPPKPRRWGIASTDGRRLRPGASARGDRAADEAGRRRDDQQPAVARGRPGGLAELAHAAGAALLADNTFAGPVVCRPRALGADWVDGKPHQEHERPQRRRAGAAVRRRGPLGARAGGRCRPGDWRRRRSIAGWHCAAWERWACGWNGPVRMRWPWPRRWPTPRPWSRRSTIPGWPTHPDHALARRQFGDRFGSMVSLHARRRRSGGHRVYESRQADSVLPVAGRNVHHAEPSGIDQPPRDSRPPSASGWGSAAARSVCPSASNRRTPWSRPCGRD